VECWTGHLDLFHATDFALPPTLPGAHTVLTIHDLAFEVHPEETMPGMLGYLKSAVPRSARRADAIIAVSEATRRDLVDRYGLPPEKISVIPHGVSSRFSPLSSLPSPPDEAGDIHASYHLPGEPFILTVGTLQPRKNHLRLVQALALMKHPASLVIVGGNGWSYEAVRAEVARLRLEDRVIFAGFARDADLPALYRAAAMFAYPALYEGFGLPILEAMACGVPVLTSTASSLPEVAGDAALLVDPLDPESIANGLGQLLDDGPLRAELIRKGLARASEFTWERCARSTWSLYQSLAAG
jgi:glycosyltransferase involved in cell wall biosynthesis